MEFLKVQRITQTAIIPSRGSLEAAGYDLHADGEYTVLGNCGQTMIKTGIIIEIPKGYYARIASRSGLSNKGLEVGAGVVDSDYRGEIKVILRNFGKNSIEILHGHRIAQLIIEKIITPNPVEVYNLSETSRGSNGFGSTGVDVSIGVESKIAASDINERNIHKYVDNIKLCNEDRVQSINGKMSFKCVNCTQLLPNFPFDGEFHKVICMVCNKENMLSFKQVI